MKPAADKAGHYKAGALICCAGAVISLTAGMTLPVALVVGAAASLVVGIIKEICDWFNRAKHTPDVWDATATFAGGLSVSLLVAFMRWSAMSITIFLLTCGLCGCSSAGSVARGVAEAAPIMGPPVPPAVASREGIKAADAKTAKIEGMLAEARAEAANLRRELVETDHAWLHRLILWLSGVCILGIVGFTIAAVFAKSWTLASAAGAFGVGLVMLQVTSFALAHIGWIIAIVVTGGVLAFLGWYLHNRTKNRALVDTAKYGDSVATILEGIGAGQQLAKLKAVASADQMDNGTKRLVTGALAKLKRIKEKSANAETRANPVIK